MVIAFYIELRGLKKIIFFYFTLIVSGKKLDVVTHQSVGPPSIYPCTTLINNKKKKVSCGLHNSVLNFLSNLIGFDLEYKIELSTDYRVWHAALKNKVSAWLVQIFCVSYN